MAATAARPLGLGARFGPRARASRTSSSSSSSSSPAPAAGVAPARARLASPRAAALGPARGGRRAAAVVPARPRGPSSSVRLRPSAALAPGELGEISAGALVTLSGVEALLGKVSFGALLAATGIFDYKAIFTDEKRAGKVEQAAMLGGNVALASLLLARWAESGHFPLSNMYESLLFLAWGITGVHLAVTSRDGFSESAVPGALAAPVALGTVAAATLALPAELQRSAALVPALKSNWLMMHVSVMMLSYATLLVGSLSCVAFLIVGASQGFEPAKETLEKLDGFVGESRGNTTHAPESSAGASGVGGGDAVELDDGDAPLSLGMKINASRRNRPQVVATASSSDGVGGQLAASTSTPASATASDAAAAAPLTGDALLREMDNLAYRCLGAGFALLTAGLVSGAVWANEAWGSYWSWDPKETWALITWFTYATYLHSRLVANKDKKEVAAVGAAGFVVVWVCYVGVNLWGVGLHSYGWFANK